MDIINSINTYEEYLAFTVKRFKERTQELKKARPKTVFIPVEEAIKLLPGRRKLT